MVQGTTGKWQPLKSETKTTGVVKPGIVNFSLVLHNHQPIGNLPHVFREVFEIAYRPFIEVYSKYADRIPIGLHISGPLLEWLSDYEKTYVSEIRDLVRSNSIELVCGGMYEPILPMLPTRDRLGQIEAMRAYLKTEFGANSSGFWLAERVWEQSLATDIRTAGLEYTIVDDSHFKAAGLMEDDLTSYFLTEDRGNVLAVFAIPEALRYAIPFKEPRETIDYLSRFRSETGENVIVYADDGEKFGSWPKTNKLIYTDGWLKKFFEEIIDNRHSVKMILPRDALKKCPPAGKVYFPDASYREMMEWALPSNVQGEFEEAVEDAKEAGVYEGLRNFLRGGTWRNFLVRYPEANRMYSRMLHVSFLIDKVISEKREGAIEARRALHKGQCNCAYWHGVFGGLYMPHLRDAVYANLIAAENLALSGKRGFKVEERDFNLDGSSEIFVRTDHVTLYVAPKHGAQLYELDLRKVNFNVMNLLQRRREHYHDKIIQQAEEAEEERRRYESERRRAHDLVADLVKTVDPQPLDEGDLSDFETKIEKPLDVETIHHIQRSKHENLDQFLAYDWYPRLSLVDHLYDPEATIERIIDDPLMEKGNFISQPYEVVARKVDEKSASIEFHREGHFHISDPAPVVQVSKTLLFHEDDAGFAIDYKLKNESSRSIEFVFAVEWNLTLLSGNAVDRYFAGDDKSSLGSLETRLDVESKSLAIVNEWDGFLVRIASDKKIGFWTSPIKSVSQSEDGFELNYQQSAVFPHQKVKIDCGREFSFGLRFEIEYFDARKNQ
ncbi:MAG: DUF1926 domain-containing protein [Planctomycetes bacterium]|nr:DUF1926 domain-containing protein [Planctomycetota bacterium]